MKIMKAVFCLALCAALSACSSTDLVPRQRKAEVIAGGAGWTYQLVEAGDFDLATYASPRKANEDLLVVYIEGDGLAFLGPRTISSDPTPTEPVALELARRDLHDNVAYVARPCQYTIALGARNCTPDHWTTRRYAPEVIDSMSAAVDTLKRDAGAKKIILVGYSGGGAVAVLLAARRSDVVGLVTVSANLDIAFWVQRDGLSPLKGSLDPADVAARVENIPQVHFVGSDDEVVGPSVTQSYLSHMKDRSHARAIEIARFDHVCCWVDQWTALAARPELADIPGWSAGATAAR
jgi:pimeloyl-ACP methyl ester carboxylesterase